MNILVCISNVPDTTSKINFVENDKIFDTNGVQFIINPNDEFGLTRAIWFQQKNQATVTVVTVGEISCEPILRKCLAIGANKAVRIDSKALDGFSVAEQLKSLCEKESFDIIICGNNLRIICGLGPDLFQRLATLNIFIKIFSIRVW